MQASLCVVRCAQSRHWAVRLCKIVSHGFYSEGSTGGIGYISSNSFLCALPVYCTLSVVQYMQLHVKRKRKKILKVRKKAFVFLISKGMSYLLLNVLMKI